METWKAKAIGTLPPSYSSEEYDIALHCLNVLNKKSVRTSGIIEKALDKIIIPEWQRKGMNIERQENNYIFAKDQKDKLMRECLTGGLESFSRRRSKDLEDEILFLLDQSPYSNTDLAKIIEVDKSQISRKIRY